MDARFSAWALQWEELQCQIAPCFGRIELRRRARSYLEGLLAPLERKNGWHLADPDGVLVIDETGATCWASPVASSFTGRTTAR